MRIQAVVFGTQVLDVLGEVLVAGQHGEDAGLLGFGVREPQSGEQVGRALDAVAVGGFDGPAQLAVRVDDDHMFMNRPMIVIDSHPQYVHIVLSTVRLLRRSTQGPRSPPGTQSSGVIVGRLGWTSSPELRPCRRRCTHGAAYSLAQAA